MGEEGTRSHAKREENQLKREGEKVKAIDSKNKYDIIYISILLRMRTSLSPDSVGENPNLLDRLGERENS